MYLQATCSVCRLTSGRGIIRGIKTRESFPSVLFPSNSIPLKIAMNSDIRNSVVRGTFSFCKMNWFSLIKLYSKSHFLLPSSPLCLLVFLFYPLQIFQHLKYEHQTVCRSLLLVLTVPYSHPYFLLSWKPASFSCCSFEIWILLACYELKLVKNQRMVWAGKDIWRSYCPAPLQWAGASSTQSGCSMPHPTWPWTFPGMGCLGLMT